MSADHYDPTLSYRDNYALAPESFPSIVVPPMPGFWTFCGLSVDSPLGIAAGPLLNGRWLLHYAALGFDILTYKTVRSGHRDCYPMPNLQPVRAGMLIDSSSVLATAESMRGNWAISFGMPSMAPDVWRADVEWTKKRLPKGKALSVSVVATPQADWSLDDLAADFAKCARWAAEAGADAVEANFSCPNVSSCDGQLYHRPADAEHVAAALRDAVGHTPLLIKIGFIEDAALIHELVDNLAPHIDGFAMTNCIAAKVQGPDGLLFNGEPRGIGGPAIRDASINQVRRFADCIRNRGLKTKLVGVGGILTVDDVKAYLDAGAETVALATAAMLDPIVGIRIREAWQIDRRPHP